MGVESKNTTGIYYGEIFFRVICVSAILLVFFLRLESTGLRVFILIVSLLLLVKSNYNTISLIDSYVDKKVEIKTNYLIPYFNKVAVYNLKEIHSIKFQRHYLTLVKNLTTWTFGIRESKIMDNLTIIKKDGVVVNINLNVESGRAENIITEIQKSIR